MKIENTAIAGVVIIHFDVHADDRGVFVETYDFETFSKVGLPTNWVQDSYSSSREAMTLRGLHYQEPPHAQAKLVRVLSGRIFDVAVDLRSESDKFASHTTIELSADDPSALLIPTGFAHGFLTLEPGTRVAYKMTDHYAPTHARGVAWDDPTLAIEWPIQGDVILSERDALNPAFDELTVAF